MQPHSLAEPGRVIAPPESRRLKAGVVTLAPGEAVGTHRTHHREELIVALAGEGLLMKPDGEQRFAADEALYVPPETEHDVRNVGDGTLRYCYVVALLDDDG